MKILVAFLILGVFTTSIRALLTKEEAITVATACKEEAGASDADFEAMIKHQPSASKEAKCMSACVFKKFGLMSDEGKLIKDTAIELSKHIVKEEDKKQLAIEAIEACEDLEVSEDHCEAAEEYAHCVKAEFETKGISSIEDLTS